MAFNIKESRFVIKENYEYNFNSFKKTAVDWKEAVKIASSRPGELLIVDVITDESWFVDKTSDPRVSMIRSASSGCG